jgi:hypothetical protein
MSLATTERIGAPELERLILDREPAAVLVSRTILRRVVRNNSTLPGLGVRIPHSVCYTVDRETLLRIVDRDELGPAASAELPSRVILIRRPEPDKLAQQAREQALLFHWRVLFHARVHLTLEEQAAGGNLSPAEARRRWQRLGDPSRREIITLLFQEHCATAGDPVALWVEFVAFYLGLRVFQPERLPDTFPGVRDFSLIDELVAADVDEKALLAATRLPGAAEPGSVSCQAENLESYDYATCFGGPNRLRISPSESGYHQCQEVASLASKRGNDVRAALSKVQAVRYADPAVHPLAMKVALEEIDRFIDRLQRALPNSAEQVAACRSVLAALTVPASEAFWPQEARLLYDLQKICIDIERPIFKIDFLGWIRSFGRLPIRRPVPGQREVLVVQHLHSALRRLPRVRVSEEDRLLLGDFLRRAQYDAEARLRETFLPPLLACLEEVGFRPRNLPEHAARDKIVEELLHRINANGLLTLGDLRDALSRNDLKLEDLRGPVQFFAGDRLLQLDRRLSRPMESVYRRGEFYLRWLQSLGSLAFGTPLGRLCTTWLALPFGGAYVLLEGLQHLVHLIGRHTFHFEIHLLSPWSFGLLGLFLAGVLNIPGFRRRLGHGLRGIGRVLHWILIAGPRALLTLPILLRFVNSPPVVFARRYLFKPALCAALVWFLHWLCGTSREWRIFWAAATFLVAWVFFVSRVGRAIEEAAADRLITAWHHLGELFPALFRFVMWVFKALLQGVDRLLYTVDEWLRFRQGESRAALAAKAVLGSVWSCVTYVVRFALTLLIEPQINPIKHFPVVTVAHKVMLPFIPTLAGVLISLTFDKPLAYTVATVIITCTPGLFGFLVWEFKENYRLYAANRAPDLRPIVVGTHGETVLRFLRPGLHSGTVPKAFARLRRALRRGDMAKRTARSEKQRDTLHHVEDAVRHFAESDLLFFLRASGRWKSNTPEVGHIILGLHSIQILLQPTEVGHNGLWVEFEDCYGRLLATVRNEGMLGSLDADQRRVLRNALIGFFKKTGVALVDAQLARFLDPLGLEFRLSLEGLAIISPEGEAEAVYDLDDEERLVARGDTMLAKSLPTFTPRELLFSADPLSWEDWLDVWESEQAGYAKELMPGLPLWKESK